MLPPYSGPWEPFVRDIDPTFLCKEIQYNRSDFISSPLPLLSSLDWVKDSSLFENSKDYQEIIIDGKEYGSLYSYFKWERKNGDDFKDRDLAVYLSSAFFVDSQNKENIIKKRKKRIEGNGVPLHSNYTIFAYEYYWCQSYKDLEQEYAKEEDDEDKMVVNASCQYLWEKTYDGSLPDGESVSYILPSVELIKYFKLNQSEPGVWQDENGHIICFDTRMIGYKQECLLVDKKKLNEFIECRGYEILWGVYAEKISTRNYHEWWYTIDYANGVYEKIVSDERSGAYK